MPSVIDHETIYVDQFPSVWSPLQEGLPPDQLKRELEHQATASLLWASPVPEQILRLLLNETAIERQLEPPEGFDPDAQGDWQSDRIAFGFEHPIKLVNEERSPDRLVLEYKLEGAGSWMLLISSEEVTIGRV